MSFLAVSRPLCDTTKNPTLLYMQLLAIIVRRCSDNSRVKSGMCPREEVSPCVPQSIPILTVQQPAVGSPWLAAVAHSTCSTEIRHANAEICEYLHEIKTREKNKLIGTFVQAIQQAKKKGWTCKVASYAMLAPLLILKSSGAKIYIPAASGKKKNNILIFFFYDSRCRGRSKSGQQRDTKYLGIQQAFHRTIFVRQTSISSNNVWVPVESSPKISNLSGDLQNPSANVIECAE